MSECYMIQVLNQQTMNRETLAFAPDLESAVEYAARANILPAILQRLAIPDESGR